MSAKPAWPSRKCRLPAAGKWRKCPVVPIATAAFCHADSFFSYSFINKEAKR
jgi:hypothetical protein